MVMKIRKAVIPVAGLGTRMLPATKAIPKELLPVLDKPIIEYVVNEAVSAGITEIILVTRSGKEAIENHFDANYELEHRLEKKGSKNKLGKIKNIIPENVKITSVRQPDALGLGHAVLCAKYLIENEPFAVLLPDVLLFDKLNRSENFSFSQLVKCWEKSQVGHLLVEHVEPDMIDKYGIIEFEGEGPTCFESVKLRGLVEKPKIIEAPSNLAVIGRYILPYEIFGYLESTSPGVGGEIQLTDALSELMKRSGLSAIITDAEIYDCGSREGFLAANLAAGLRNLEIKKYLMKVFNKTIV